MSGSGAQQTRKPHAEQTVEVERNDTGGTGQVSLAATCRSAVIPSGAITREWTREAMSEKGRTSDEVDDGCSEDCTVDGR